MTFLGDQTIATALTLDDLMTVEDLSPDLLRLMASRIKASYTVEQIVYRETELDEVWRLADIALAEGRFHKDSPSDADAAQLAAVAELVYAAHDLIGQNEDVVGAAAALRKAASLMASPHVTGR